VGIDVRWTDVGTMSATRRLAETAGRTGWGGRAAVSISFIESDNMTHILTDCSSPGRVFTPTVHRCHARRTQPIKHRALFVLDIACLAANVWPLSITIDLNGFLHADGLCI